jgi:hypothetical protein
MVCLPRSVQFTTDKAIASSRSLQLTLPGGSLAPELYVLKMTQQYERDHSVPPGTVLILRHRMALKQQYDVIIT